MPMTRVQGIHPDGVPSSAGYTGRSAMRLSLLRRDEVAGQARAGNEVMSVGRQTRGEGCHCR